MISSQKSVVHNELLVKSEILHWNCDCSLHLDVLCSTTIFTIQRLKPEWNFTQEKENWSKDIILLRSVQMCGCYVYTLFTAEWLTFLCIKLLFFCFFFVWFFSLWNNNSVACYTVWIWCLQVLLLGTPISKARATYIPACFPLKRYLLKYDFAVRVQLVSAQASTKVSKYTKV